MSLRKSLYKHHNRNGASTSSFMNYAEKQSTEKHWKRDWYDPPKVNKDVAALQQKQGSVMGQLVSGPITPAESTPQPQAGSGAQTPVPVETYGFKIKTWIITEELQVKTDCADEEKDTILPLSKLKYDVDSNDHTEKADTTSGLSEADIKSAVGGAGVSNSLFSSSAAQELKTNAEKDAEAAAPVSAEPAATATATATATAEPRIQEIKEEPAPAETAAAASALAEDASAVPAPVKSEEVDADGDVKM